MAVRPITLAFSKKIAEAPACSPTEYEIGGGVTLIPRRDRGEDVFSGELWFCGTTCQPVELTENQVTQDQVTRIEHGISLLVYIIQ